MNIPEGATHRHTACVNPLYYKKVDNVWLYFSFGEWTRSSESASDIDALEPVIGSALAADHKMLVGDLSRLKGYCNELSEKLNVAFASSGEQARIISSLEAQIEAKDQVIAGLHENMIKVTGERHDLREEIQKGVMRSQKLQSIMKMIISAI